MLSKDINELWKEYHCIKNDWRVRSVSGCVDEDFVERIEGLGKKIVDFALEAKNRKEYESLGDIFYHCEEFLMRDLARCSSFVFPLYLHKQETTKTGGKNVSG